MLPFSGVCTASGTEGASGDVFGSLKRVVAIVPDLPSSPLRHYAFVVEGEDIPGNDFSGRSFGDDDPIGLGHVSCLL